MAGPICYLSKALMPLAVYKIAGNYRKGEERGVGRVEEKGMENGDGQRASGKRCWQEST